MHTIRVESGPFEPLGLGVIVLDLDYLHPDMMLALRNALVLTEESTIGYLKDLKVEMNREVSDAIDLLDNVIRMSGMEGGHNRDNWCPEES